MDRTTLPQATPIARNVPGGGGGKLKAKSRKQKGAPSGSQLSAFRSQLSLALRDREQPAQLRVSRVARTGCQLLLEPRPVAGDYLGAVAVSLKDERIAQGRWAADGHIADLWRVSAPVTDRDGAARRREASSGKAEPSGCS